MCYYEMRKSLWRNRWHVFRIGHLVWDETWLASFRYETHAEGYLRRLERMDLIT
jgi:hypothetical protein